MPDDEAASHDEPWYAETLAVVQRTVIRGILPARVVVHDEGDDWLIGDAVNDPNEEGACGLFHLSHVVSSDPSIRPVLRMPKGRVANRESPKEAWVVSPWAYDERP